MGLYMFNTLVPMYIQKPHAHAHALLPSSEYGNSLVLVNFPSYEVFPGYYVLPLANLFHILTISIQVVILESEK